MTTNHSPAPSDAVKDTGPSATVPPEESTVAENRAADTPDAEQPTAQNASAPPVPPGPDLDADQEQMLLGFYADPAQFPELNDGGANLPRSVSPMLATLSEWAHRLAGSGIDVQSLDGRPKELLRAAAFFVNRALLAPRGSHYRVLGLNPNASAGDIHDHYRYLRRLFSVADPDGSAHAAVMRVSEAYVVLRDPARRRSYDASLFGSSALPRLEAERRGAEGGRFAAAPTTAGRNKRVLGMATAFVVVLTLFWWFGGFEEPTIEVPVAVDETATAPESVATTQEPTPSTEPAASAEAESQPTPSAAESAVSATDEALLDRVEQFANAEPPESADGTTPTAPVAPPPVAASGAPETGAPAESATEPQVTAGEPSAQTTADADKTSSSAPPLTGADTAADDAAVSPTRDEAPAAGPEVTVIPVTPEAAPAAAPETPKPESEIEQLLARADRQLADGQLTTPPGNSAADSYREVLRREPGNTRATEGMSAIADRYAMLARYRLRRDELGDARTMVERGLELAPSHSGLLAARSDIESRAEALAAAKARAEAAAREESVATLSAAPSSSTLSADVSTALSSSVPSATAASPAATAPAAATPPPIRPVPQDSSISAGVDAAQSPPAVVASAPPPAASSTPPSAPQALEPEAPLSDRALNDLVAKFVRYYEGGDLEAFMNLFAFDAETNSRKGAKGIRQDYLSLFEGSESRLMRLKDMRWSRSKDEAVGEADFNLSLFGRRESRPSAYEGRLTFRVVEINGEPVIKGLFHSQRKLEDG